MCRRCKNSPGTVILKFPSVTKQCICGCNCNETSPPPNNDYIIKPQGGIDGNFLIKSGNGVIYTDQLPGSLIENESINVNKLGEDVLLLITNAYNNTVAF